MGVICPHHFIHILNNASHRKIFGSGVNESTGTPKKLRITSQTTYMLMRKQAQQVATGMAELEQQVCIRMDSKQS